MAKDKTLQELDISNFEPLDTSAFIEIDTASLEEIDLSAFEEITDPQGDERRNNGKEFQR